MVPLQQLQRVMEAHPLGPHHPQKHVAALPASALATPDILRRIDIQARIPVVMERAQPDKLLAAANQLDPPRLRQPLDGNLPLDPLLHVLGNIGHFVDPPFSAFLQKTCQVLFCGKIQFINRFDLYGKSPYESRRVRRAACNLPLH